MPFLFVSDKIQIMKIRVVKEKRKTLLLKIISKDEILVKAPTKLNDGEISNFISSKKKWFEEKVKKMERLKNYEKSFHFDEFIYENLTPIMKTSELNFDFDKFSERKQQKVIKEQYLSMFPNLKTRAEKLGLRYNFDVKEILPCSSTCKWGSFSSQKVMKLNFKLIILPNEIIDYVIIHELCHSKHMNHKPQFWREVEKYCKNYKDLRQKIKDFSFVLKTSF